MWRTPVCRVVKGGEVTLDKVITTLGAVLSIGIGYAAFKINDLGTSSDSSIQALLMLVAVLVVCLISYRSGLVARRKR